MKDIEKDNTKPPTSINPKSNDTAAARLSAEDIRGMSIEEWKKRRKELLKQTSQ